MSWTPAVIKVLPLYWRNQNCANSTHTTTTTRPTYPKVHLSVLRTAYVRIFKFLTSFFLQMHHQSVKTKVNFSITHLVRTVCQLTTSTKQTRYTWTTLFCIHLRNSFSIEHRRTLSPPKNTPCALLSLMLTRPFLSGFGLVGVCFLRFVHFPSSSSVSCSHLSPTAMKMANF